MRRFLSVPALILALTLTQQFMSAGQATSGKKRLTYDLVFGSPMGDRGASPLATPLPQITGWLDGETYLETRTATPGGQRRVYAVSASAGSERVLRDLDELQKHLPSGFSAGSPAAVTPDGKRFIFSRENDLYLFDTEGNRFRRLTATPAREETPKLSPDGKWVAYTREHNLFACELDSGIEHQFTTDGSAVVYNGYSSWVYYEEILGRASQYAAFWWSPDSSSLAFMRFDDTPVPVFPIYHANGQHGELENQHYPKAGDPNPWVALGIVKVADGKTVWTDFESKADHYIAWPFWTPGSSTLTVQWMNRGQDVIRLYSCDAGTGKKTLLHEEKQASWVRFFEDLHHFRNGTGFLLRSDVDGWDHLYLYGNDGKLKKRLTSGEWRVSSIARVDEESGQVFFVARRGKSWNSHLMRVKLDGSGLEQITREDGTHAVQVAPGGRYFIDTYSSISTPAVMNLMRTDGTLVRRLGDAKSAAMDEYAWGRAELFTIPSGDGYDLPAWWVLPPDFDPAKQYPVIFSIYGGPDAGMVRNAGIGLSPHFWAQEGIITVSVDHRGSGHFGKKRTALMHRNLGKWEMADLIAAATWLRSKPFVAKDKIGITGSSYGGYTTMMALTFGAGHFNYGLAGSSVTDWKLYDSVYTERYMDTPDENPEGYKNGAVLTWTDRYKGGLRITHGTIDDNVHMQNSIQVVDWLTNHNRPFELMLYPGSRHGIQPGQRAHLSRQAYEFWMQKLLGRF